MKNLFTLLVLSLLTVPTFAVRYHVKTTGSDAAAGTGWTVAFATLQKALTAAASGDEIWVATGTYYPDEGGTFSNNDRNAYFSMKNGVAIYGGFPATGTPTMTDRNWINNPTILSGEIQQDNDISNNSYNIIYNFYNNLDATSLLDGFTVSGGYADGIDYRTLYGGGVHNRNTAPAFQNCTFSGNHSIAYGGGMYNEASSPNLVNCSFQANQAMQGGGGGMFNINVLLSFTLTNCSFSGNKAREGGAIYTTANVNASLTLINCSFSGNQAEIDGALSSFSSTTLTNCIVWGNSSPQMSDLGGVYSYTHCLIEGLNPSGTGNLDGTNPINNPLFVTQPDFNSAPTTNGNLRLQPCSPAINAGSNGTFTNADKDLDGNARLVNTTVDLGAYESQFAPTAAIIPIVDATNPTTCGGNNGSITLSGFLINTNYSVTYKKDNNAVAAANFTSNGNGEIVLTGLGAGSYTDVVATSGICVSTPATATLSDPAKPSITLGTIPAICAGAMSFTIPHTNPVQLPNTYSISGTGITGATDGDLTNPINVTLSMGASGSSIPFTLTVKNSTTNCESAPIMGSVAVNPASEGGSITGTATVCAGTNSTVLILSNHTGDIQKWQSSFTSDFATSTDIANTATQLTATNLTQTMYYRAVVKSSVCDAVSSAPVTVTVNPLPSATISASAVVCQNASAPTLTFTGTHGIAPYTFTYKINNGPELTASTTGGNSATITPSTTTADTFIYTLVRVSDANSCAQTVSDADTITILAPTTPTALAGIVIYLGQSATLTANGCSGQGFTLLWYKSSDNTPVTMPLSPTMTASYYARCQQTVGQTSCLSDKTPDVTIVVGQRIFVNAANGNPTQDGTSWNTAFASLQNALSAARNAVFLYNEAKEGH